MIQVFNMGLKATQFSSIMFIPFPGIPSADLDLRQQRL